MQISPNDHRGYRHLTLDNGLRVLLIEDAHAPRSAAALTVNVGHFCDPTEREGLAHFLEHMLFLGTEKYPVVGEFQSFISRHGGSNNAWTGTENTTFFFDIQHTHFEEALDRFSQFFTAPLFNADAVDKERNAVDSEYKLKLQDDVRRIYQVQKETINPAHPFSKFSVGSAETLNDRAGSAIRDELIAFYQRHYSANLMAASIIGPFTLDSLEDLAREAFDAIPNLDLPLFIPDVPFTDKAQLQQFIAIEPLKDIRKLTLAFAMPSTDEFYKIKPLSYIAHLLGYEGSGSVMSLLKGKGYINNLSAGGGISGSNFREFTVSVGLTELGLSKVDNIVTYIFQAINLIKDKGLAEWRYAEKRAVQEMAFRYQEPSRPLDTVSHIVLNLQHYDADDVLYGDYMMQTFDESLIRRMLGYLIPDNLRLTLIAKGGKYDKQAKWYDTPYSVKPFTPQQLEKWRSTLTSPALSLPDQNPFISYEIDPAQLESPEQQKPELIQELPGFRLWHLQDNDFRVPKGVIYVAIDSPHAVSSVENIVKTRVSVEMLLEAINETAYPAEVAGLSYNLYAHQGGVTLKLSGFNEKLPLLLDLVLEKFATRDFKPERFDIIKTQLLRGWKNATQNKPISRLYNAMTGILQPNNPPYEQLIKALEPLQVSALPDFVHRVMSELHVEMFVYGNWQQQTLQLAEAIKHALRVNDQRYQESTRPLVLLHNAGSASYHLDSNQQDSAVLVYYQSHTSEPQDVAMYTFAQHLMSAIFFNELRTKQQLGYMVGSGNMPLNRHPGLIFYVQSPQVGPTKLMEAIDDFLNAFFLVLLELNDAQWQASKQGLIAQIEEPDANLRARGQRLWISIGNKDTHFEQRKKVADAIKKMDRADMVRFVVEQLKPRTSDRLVMHSCGLAHPDQCTLEGTNEITSVAEFRRNRLERV
ncbi:insulinase family protein [Enterovibrio nigricans]|uniref:Protease 3 n=1 Tax=Enterovibrio nigricans DSM 22720 TaxID=1121868 RepID=A0A1T4U7P6_9GAMM|nr:insulinase family protein [Enterovibrio nigricans]SKA48687.1 Secreted Zn-dependent peptidases, insulinase-like [Enterovibrio nigricans DSM 22720]